jgi:Selenocysteine synthase N terminal
MQGVSRSAPHLRQNGQMAHDPFRELPPMNRLLAHPSTERLLVQFNMENVVQGCRDILDDLRRAITEGFAIDPAALEPGAILDRVESRLAAASRVGLQRVVNASSGPPRSPSISSTTWRRAIAGGAKRRLPIC